MSNVWKPLSAGEIENRIEKLAASYVPEWRFNRDDPDIGSSDELSEDMPFAGLFRKKGL